MLYILYTCILFLSRSIQFSFFFSAKFRFFFFQFLDFYFLVDLFSFLFFFLLNSDFFFQFLDFSLFLRTHFSSISIFFKLIFLLLSSIKMAIIL